MDFDLPWSLGLPYQIKQTRMYMWWIGAIKHGYMGRLYQGNITYIKEVIWELEEQTEVLMWISASGHVIGNRNTP